MTYVFRIFSLSFFLCIVLAYSKYVDWNIEKEPEFSLLKYPVFTSKKINGNGDLNSQDLKLKSGEILVVHFWATWCSPCKLELPKLISFLSTLPEKNVKVLLIAVNEKKSNVLAEVSNLISNSRKNFIWTYTDSNDVLLKFGSTKIPETFLFNSSFQFVKKFIGPQDWERSFYKREFLRFIN